MRWFVNGQEQKDGVDGCKLLSLPDGTYAMKLPNVPEMKDAKVVCKASNDDGEAESNCLLNVTPADVPPKFTEVLKDTTITIGDPMRCRVTVAGIPEPTLTWFFNGNEITSATMPGFKIDVNGLQQTISVDTTTMDNTGTLQCKGVNIAGSCSTQCQITIVGRTSPPVFDNKPTDATVKEGGACEFTADASGEPMPTFTWYLNDKPLKGTEPGITITADNGKTTLRIADCQKAHTGNVRVKAENKGGAVEVSAKLNVENAGRAPQLVSKPHNDTIQEGENVEFDAAADGDPVPAFKWYLNGRELSPSDGNCTIKTDGGTTALVIKAATQAQSGEITVKAENKYGSTEAKARLTVTEKSELPRFTKSLDDKLVEEKQPLTAECEVTGQPEPSVTWQLNGKPLSAGAGVTVKKDGPKCTLTIAAVASEHSGGPFSETILFLSHFLQVHCNAKRKTQQVKRQQRALLV